jgi:hypothetical protein
MEIDYEPRFVDEAVLRAAAARPEGRLFYRERERAYALDDPDERALAFDRLSATWFDRLGLAQPLRAALAEQPLVGAAIARCAVGRPPHPRDRGAELLVRTAPGTTPGAAARLLRLLLPPEILLAPAIATPFLRRELQHIADMLDPAFGYEPRLPPAAGGATHERLLRDRYRVVWDTTVDGRLLRRGWHAPAVRAERHDEFMRTFAALGDAAPRAFARFFEDPAPSHRAIVAFIIAPFADAGAGVAGPRACPLCGFPTATLADDLTDLPSETLAEIERAYAGWTPAVGCCPQCADLYRARPMSLRSAAALPGVR